MIRAKPPRGVLFASLAALATASAGAQEAVGSTALGLRHVGALAVSAGWAEIEHAARGVELGVLIDFGSLGSRRTRVTADVAFLRTLRLREYIVADDATYQDVFYDLSGHVGLTVLGRDPARGLVPYASLGAGVHVLTSSFGSIVIDQRYNSNAFGLMGAAGMRVRAGRSRGLMVEVRRIQADHVSRSSLHIGMMALFGNLRR